MDIKLLDKDYKFVYNWGSLYTYEKITDEALNLEKSYCRHVLLYSILLFNNADTFTLSFNDFVNVLEDYSVLTMLTDALIKELERKGMYQNSKDEENKKKE